jgi:hypothetical protein
MLPLCSSSSLHCRSILPYCSYTYSSQFFHPSSLFFLLSLTVGPSFLTVPTPIPHNSFILPLYSSSSPSLAVHPSSSYTYPSQFFHPSSLLFLLSINGGLSFLSVPTPIPHNFSILPLCSFSSPSLSVLLSFNVPTPIPHNSFSLPLCSSSSPSLAVLPSSLFFNPLPH